jgi:hypothetical protein
MQKEEEAANLERWALELENLGTRPARLQWNVPQVQDSLTQGNDDQNNGRLGSGCESDMMLNDDSGCVLGDVSHIVFRLCVCLMHLLARVTLTMELVSK